MGDLLVWIIEQYSGWAIIIFVAAYLLAEFLLDIVHDLFLDWLHSALERRRLGRLFGKRESGERDSDTDSDSPSGTNQVPIH